MLNILRHNPWAFVCAIVVHLLLIAALSFNIDWNSKQKLSAPKVNVIQAVMIDDPKAKVEARKLAQEKRRQAELKKKKEAEKKRKAEQDKKRKQAEADKKRKQTELEKKKEAEKKHKTEQDKKRKAEAEKKRKAELKKKQEAEQQRKQAELKKKQATEKKRLAKLEKKRQAEAERLRKLEEQRKADEQRRAEEEKIRQQQMAEEEAAMNAARQRALQSELERFKALIGDRIENKWFRPTNWRAGTSCTVAVRLVPGTGTARVIDVRLVSSCGNPLFDRSVENAVYSASPLPISTAPELIEQFREMTFNFKPE